MDWKKLSDKASDVIAKRGGVESLSQDASELQDIVSGEGTLAEKAKRAMAAVKEPGRHPEPGGTTETAAESSVQATSTTEEEH